MHTPSYTYTYIYIYIYIYIYTHVYSSLCSCILIYTESSYNACKKYCGKLILYMHKVGTTTDENIDAGISILSEDLDLNVVE